MRAHEDELVCKLFALDAIDLEKLSYISLAVLLSDVLDLSVRISDELDARVTYDGSVPPME